MDEGYDKELVNILKKYFNATLKEPGSAYYNVFLISPDNWALADIARILIVLKVDFEYSWEDYEDDPENEYHEGSLYFAACELKSLKKELREIIP